jgi:hypothetical protein
MTAKSHSTRSPPVARGYPSCEALPRAPRRRRRRRDLFSGNPTSHVDLLLAPVAAPIAHTLRHQSVEDRLLITSQFHCGEYCAAISVNRHVRDGSEGAVNTPVFWLARRSGLPPKTGSCANMWAPTVTLSHRGSFRVAISRFRTLRWRRRSLRAPPLQRSPRVRRTTRDRRYRPRARGSQRGA